MPSGAGLGAARAPALPEGHVLLGVGHAVGIGAIEIEELERAGGVEGGLVAFGIAVLVERISAAERILALAGGAALHVGPQLAHEVAAVVAEAHHPGEVVDAGDRQVEPRGHPRRHRARLRGQHAHRLEQAQGEVRLVRAVAQRERAHAGGMARQGDAEHRAGIDEVDHPRARAERARRRARSPAGSAPRAPRAAARPGRWCRLSTCACRAPR